MSVKRITESAVSRLQTGETVWDETVKGFGVRRQRHAVVYVFKYRLNGKQRFMTIGRHGSPWTAEEARTEAKRHLYALIDKSRQRDPAAERDVTKSEPTFAQFAATYLTDYAAMRKKPRSLAEDKRNLDLHILPTLGELKLNKIARRDVIQLHTSQCARPINANRCLSLISHICSIAEKWELRSVGTNPCRGIERYQEKPRERFLTDAELGRLGAALAMACHGYGKVGWQSSSLSNPPTRKAAEDWRAIACIRLLLFTGARLTEILSLRWSWIDWDRGLARLPDSKTGAKTLTLTKQALARLRDLEAKVQGEYPDNAFVLPGIRAGTYFTGIQKPWQRIRDLAGLGDVRIHDLRHAFASTAVSGGDSLYIVGAILGHRQTATTQRYAHLAREPVREVADRAAGKIARLLEGRGGSETEERVAP